MKDEIQTPKVAEKRHRCEKGDIIGCLIDFENLKCVYYVNGHEFSIHIQLGDMATKGVYPIICLTQYQHIRINLAQGSWLYKSPRHVKPLKADFPVPTTTAVHDEDDWDCTLCFSEPKSILLLPCNHSGFGKNCAEKLTSW